MGGYIFEQDTLVLGEARGYADVFKRDHFAWENKAPGKNLDTALKQLLTYSLALANPPLLVVCDRLTIRIHTQFNGHPSETHTVLLHELAQPEKLALLRRACSTPRVFAPRRPAATSPKPPPKVLPPWPTACAGAVAMPTKWPTS